MLVVWTRMVAKGDRNKLKGLRYVLLISGWGRNEMRLLSRVQNIDRSSLEGKILRLVLDMSSLKTCGIST